MTQSTAPHPSRDYHSGRLLAQVRAVSPLSGNFGVGTRNKCIDLSLVREMIKHKIWKPLVVMFSYHVEKGTLLSQNVNVQKPQIRKQNPDCTQVSGARFS